MLAQIQVQIQVLVLAGFFAISCDGLADGSR